jgi:hypothetical protein
MALSFEPSPAGRDPRALPILAKTIYKELRDSGYTARDVMSLAAELLGIVAGEVRTSRDERA